jgi:probable rRNA maturation factor
MLPARTIETIKKDILGEEYELSVAFVSIAKSQEINKKYRGKDKPTNVLSFSLRKNEGELVLCKAIIKEEAKEKTQGVDRNFDQWLGFLVIHGMLHLKGHKHGGTMSKLEKKYDTKYFSRNRHRLIDDASLGGRILKRRKKS